MKSRKDWLLFGLASLYATASLIHFTHNAEFLGDYPNLPSFFSRVGVYLAWIGVVSIGAAGIVLYFIRWRVLGLLLLAVYAALGLDGLLHYTLAPFSAHTGMMNFTILFEVVTAAALLFVVVCYFAILKREAASATI